MTTKLKTSLSLAFLIRVLRNEGACIILKVTDAEAYIRFLAHELVPYIDDNYPTYQIGAGRALIGDSLAATISLLTASKYPNIFGKVILHSPYVDDLVLEKVEAAQDPSAFSIYHVIGEGETEVKTQIDGVQDFLTPNRKLNELIERKGFPYFYEEFNGDHTWKHWQPDVRRAIQMVFGIKSDKTDNIAGYSVIIKLISI